MKLYESFIRHGWTTDLANKTKKQLIPIIVQAITTAWYVALTNANRED